VGIVVLARLQFEDLPLELFGYLPELAEQDGFATPRRPVTIID
jgi:hypothetical protein